MKTKVVFSVALILGVFYTSLASNPYAWSGEKPRTAWKNWSISVNAGVTSYFGDLSHYDNDLIGKLKFESEPAFSFMINKQFNSAFSLGGQVLYGGLSNENQNITDFRTNFVEYNFQGRLNLIETFNGDKVSRFRMTAFAGLGQFIFKTVDYLSDGNVPADNIHDTGVPEFVYFGGGELSYVVNDRLVITADLAIRQAQNDKLDNVHQGGDYDYYSFSSIGITYRFKDLFGTKKLPNLTRYEYTF